MCIRDSSELLADMEKGTVTSIEIQDGGENALVELEGDYVPKEVNIPDINSFMTYAQEILKTNSYTLTERPESVFMKGLYLIIPFGIIVIVLLFGLLLINPGNQGEMCIRDRSMPTLPVAEEDYNSIIWLLNHAYIQSAETATQDKATLLANAGITGTIELTDDDLDVIQQLAIWYFTNKEDPCLLYTSKY